MHHGGVKALGSDIINGRYDGGFVSNRNRLIRRLTAEFYDDYVGYRNTARKLEDVLFHDHEHWVMANSRYDCGHKSCEQSWENASDWYVISSFKSCSAEPYIY